MNIIKRMTMALAVMVFLFSAGCVSNPSTRSDSVSGQDELDLAIRDTSDYLNDNIPKGHKIVILNIQSDYPDLSDYIIDELIANAVNDKNFSVVDRQQLDAIRAEQNFQWSGEVDDKAAVDIGKLLGAQTIVSGAMGPLGERYRLRIRALEVQTAQVQGQYNRNMIPSPILNDLIKSGSGTGTRTAAASGGSPASGAAASSGTSGQTAQQPAAPAQPATTTPTVYKVGDTGPAGGLIFYDKGNNNNGWRYLEAAPNDFPRPLQFTSEGIPFEQDRAVGRGKSNTQRIMAEAANRGGGFGWAAQACDAFVLKGFDDWFLPSRDELHYMYGNLHMQGLGDFKNEWYWSSTGNAWAENFSDGSQRDIGYTNSCRVRAIRQVAGQ